MIRECPNMMVMIKIASLYPDNLLCIAIHDEDDNKWGCALVETKDNGIGETIYSFEQYIHNTEEEAMIAMDKVLKIAIDTVKVMSN